MEQNDNAPTIMDAGIEVLEHILQTNSLPEGMTLKGLEVRPDAERLFKHRYSPKYIAKALLADILKTRVMSEGSDIKDERLALKKIELDLKAKKMESQAQLQRDILARLRGIEDTQRILLQRIEQVLSLRS